MLLCRLPKLVIADTWHVPEVKLLASGLANVNVSRHFHVQEATHLTKIVASVYALAPEVLLSATDTRSLTQKHANANALLSL